MDMHTSRYDHTCAIHIFSDMPTYGHAITFLSMAVWHSMRTRGGVRGWKSSLRLRRERLTVHGQTSPCGVHVENICKTIPSCVNLYGLSMYIGGSIIYVKPVGVDYLT